MKVEVPEFKRCCCCLPLRRGLLAWGYIKLILTVLLLSYFVYVLIILIKLRPDFIILVFIVVILLIDIAILILFLVGAHHKSARLLRIFYIYNVVMTVISGVLLLGATLLKIVNARHSTGLLFTSSSIYSSALTLFLDIGLQVYFVLLIRSEMKKLQNSCNFRFDNTEAQCTMEIDRERTDDV